MNVPERRSGTNLIAVLVAVFGGLGLLLAWIFGFPWNS